MATYDMLHSPDFLVADPDSMAAMLIEHVGLPVPDPEWTQEFPGHGYRAIFARVHRSRSFAPTRLEIIGARPIAQPVDPNVPRTYIDEYSRAQGSRPLKTHATVFTTSDIAGLIERVKARRLRHRIDPITPELPHVRLWIGVTPDAPGDYRADDDAGIFFEAIPTQGLHLQRAPGDPAPTPSEPLVSGQMARVLAREYLVGDLDQALRVLSHNLDFETASPVAYDLADGCRRAILAMTMRHAATLELIQPVAPDTEAGRYFGRWGAGPYYTRIAVAGLEAKADDLERRGTAFHRLPGERPRLRVDIDGALLEFVELGGAI
jgi:hypothetical protein